jgi:hypothetical protein
MVGPKPRLPPDERRAPLALRPLARAVRISLFEREVRERLSRAALDVIFAAAGIMSEGQRSARKGRELFFGSTMLTIELEGLQPEVRDAADARSAQRLAGLLGVESASLARIKRIAAAEVERLSNARPRTVSADVKVRSRGTTVYIDVDVEAELP